MGNQNKDEKSYGRFKGLIRVADKVKMNIYEEEIKKSQVTGQIGKMKNLNTRYAFLVMAILGNTNLYFSLFTFHLIKTAVRPHSMLNSK